MTDYVFTPSKKNCAVIYKPYGTKCGKPQHGFTNHMEPLCKEHFEWMFTIQAMMILATYRGSWGAYTNAYHRRMWLEQYRNGYLSKDDLITLGFELEEINEADRLNAANSVAILDEVVEMVHTGQARVLSFEWDLQGDGWRTLNLRIGMPEED